jgi:hypothetical protein
MRHYMQSVTVLSLMLIVLIKPIKLSVVLSRVAKLVVVMLSVIMLSFMQFIPVKSTMLTAVLLSVVAPIMWVLTFYLQ